MHKVVEDCEGPGVIQTANLARTKLLIVQRGQFITVTKSVLL